MAKIQAQWRMFATRKLFRQKKAAQIKIAAEWRMWKCKCHYQKMRNAAIVIQSYQRGMEARKLLKEYLNRLAITSLRTAYGPPTKSKNPGI